jgi:ADP-ribosylglycohydrolase
MDDLSLYSLVYNEINQQRVTGHEVGPLAERFARLGPNDAAPLEDLLTELGELPPPVDWLYEEPDSLDAILDSLPAWTARTEHRAVSDAQLDDRVLGGWIGRLAGCNLGKPIEDPAVWTTDRIRHYLELADAWPLRDYVPVLDPLPPGYRLKDCWPNTTRGNINGSDRDDDIDYSILGLDLLEKHGASLATRDVADAWLATLPFMQVHTAEAAAFRNLVNGLPAEDARSIRNPFREWIGALIRADIFGWVNPGNPGAAIRLAYRDATLSHVANGVYGELWAAALVASAFVAVDAREAVERSLGFVPPRSRLAEALRRVIALRDEQQSWEQAVSAIQAEYRHYDPVHTINNAAIIVAGLLWGGNDYAAVVGLTVSGGWDTDSNGATAGSVSGVLLGASRLPGQFVGPLNDRTRSSIFGYDNSSIGELARRTARLARDGIG